MKQYAPRVMICLLIACALCACGAKTYKDGTFSAESFMFVNDDGTDDGNGYGVVTLTLKDGEITDCTFQTFEPDGTLKDENYGKVDGEISNRDFFNKAQKAVRSCDEYARILVETGSIKEVDAISGATVNYDEFVDAVDGALSEAAK